MEWKEVADFDSSGFDSLDSQLDAVDAGVDLGGGFDGGGFDGGGDGGGGGD